MQTLNLLFIGDWGRRGERGQRQVAESMGRVAAQQGCAAVITTGDNFYKDGVLGVSDHHWTASFNDVYTSPSLRLPWYAALGNHDYRGDPDSQIEYSRLDQRWRLPGRYYGRAFPFDAEHAVELLVLDTTPFLADYRAGGAEATDKIRTADPAAQLAWLDQRLTRSTARWKLVVGHHPVLSGSPFHGSTPELGQLLRPRFERCGVHAYICGHEHDLQHLSAGGVEYLVSGAAAEWRETGELPETLFSYAGLGFLRVAVEANELRFCCHDGGGREIYMYKVRHPVETPIRHRAAYPSRAL